MHAKRMNKRTHHFSTWFIVGLLPTVHITIVQRDGKYALEIIWAVLKKDIFK